MFGAIAGDVIGKPYEIYPVKYRDFILLSDNAGVTDDTMMTCAVASAILKDKPYASEMKAWFFVSQGRVPYGNRFEDWALSDYEGDSKGNGSAMRVSSIAWLAPDLRTALRWAAASARPSHNHPEAIAAAQATVAAARLGIEGFGLDDVRKAVEKAYGYDLTTPLGDYRAEYEFEYTAAPTVRPSLRAVIEASSFEDALRNAISMGGDADTMAAIAGGVAEVFFPVPEDIRAFVTGKLPPMVRQVLTAFDARRASVLADIKPTPRDEVDAILAAALKETVSVPKPGFRQRWQALFSRASN